VSEPTLVVRARRLRAARGVVVARDVALAAVPGDVVAVEGPNGSGKSTLLAAAAGLLPADGASVRPGSVGYSPERAGVLPRVPLQRWLLGVSATLQSWVETLALPLGGVTLAAVGVRPGALVLAGVAVTAGLPGLAGVAFIRRRPAVPADLARIRPVMTAASRPLSTAEPDRRCADRRSPSGC